MKILVTESIAEKGIEILKQSGAKVDVNTKITRQELLETIGSYDAIVVRSVTKINEEFYQHATNLRVVGRAGNGVDNIEMEGATKRGIIVVNTPDSNVVSAAEHTIGLLLASIRNLPEGNKRVKAGSWNRDGLKGAELLHKTLGIIGLGRIGSLVATRLKAFGMHVIAYDPYISESRFKKYGVERKEALEDLLKEADFITVHTPKTEETVGMIGEEQFKIVRKGVRVVNCARGGIIDEQALSGALKAGIVASAGIDVLVDETKVDSPIVQFDNVVVTPHLGADTVEAQNNVGIAVAQEVISALHGEMVPNAVNLPTIQGENLDALKSYLALGETLGKMYYQLEKEAVEKVEIMYGGEAAGMETSIITLAILKGIFEPVLKEKINYVNAKIIAENRGVLVTESTESNADHYLNLITLKIAGQKDEFTISGTIFGKGEQRIIRLNKYELDVTPTPYMLVAENIDKPGVVGQIGTLLGASKINIATMQLGRTKQGAMMVIAVDSDIPKETLNLIGGIEGMSRVRFVKM